MKRILLVISLLLFADVAFGQISNNVWLFTTTVPTGNSCGPFSPEMAGATSGILYTCQSGAYAVAGGGGGGSGTVTSVAMTVPGVIFTSPVSGSPITTSGTLALALATQTANTVLAGPTSGAAATPTFRTMTAADIPNVASANLMYQPGLTLAAHAGDINLGSEAINSGTSVASTSSTIVVTTAHPYYANYITVSGATGDATYNCANCLLTSGAGTTTMTYANPAASGSAASSAFGNVSVAAWNQPTGVAAATYSSGTTFGAGTGVCTGHASNNSCVGSILTLPIASTAPVTNLFTPVNQGYGCSAPPTIVTWDSCTGGVTTSGAATVTAASLGVDAITNSTTMPIAGNTVAGGGYVIAANQLNFPHSLVAHLLYTDWSPGTITGTSFSLNFSVNPNGPFTTGSTNLFSTLTGIVPGINHANFSSSATFYLDTLAANEVQADMISHFNTALFASNSSIGYPLSFTTSPATDLFPGGKFTATGLATMTVPTGITAVGTGTCLLTAFNGATGTGATATVTITSNSATAVTITNTGVGYTTTSTSATVGNGTLTCTGTAAFTSTLGGPQGFAVTFGPFVIQNP